MIIALGNLAGTHLKLGNFAEALPLCEEGLAAAARCEAIRRTDDGTIKFQSYLGEIHMENRNFADVRLAAPARASAYYTSTGTPAA